MGRRDELNALFDALYEKHARRVHAFLLGRTGNDDVAADLLQDTFVRTWRHLDELREMPEERRGFWLFRVARNRLYDYYRRQRTRRGELPLGDSGLEAIRNASADERGYLDVTLDIDAAIASLPERLRTVLVMQSLGGMSSIEIGQALGRPPGTVRYQLSQARHRLAVMLGLASPPRDPGEAKRRA